MKKILLTLGLCLLSIISYAQSAVQQADHAFASGNYSDATQLYEMAASTIANNETERKKLYDAANNCRKLVSLHAKANKAYQAQQYETAMESYNLILKYNPKDSRANTRKKEYIKATQYAQEIAMWKKVDNQQKFTDKVTEAKEYLKQYPSGRYKDEAKNLIAEGELWEKVNTEKTYTAYQYYIENSKLKIYQKEAEKAISKIDDRLWEYAKILNTQESYLEYLNLQKNRNGKYIDDAECLYYLMCARDLFNKKDYINAYDCFVAAKDHVYYDSDKKKKYQCLEYKYYIKACSQNGTINDCQIYLKKYTYKDIYYSQVEDKMMLLLCTNGEFNEAMKYAKLKSEKKYVKKAQKAWRKAHK